ncbi:RNA-directed DNA polymerase, eukaryota, reverse transcriptase zinc-binding domain protein [Tanacetum coccineum]
MEGLHIALRDVMAANLFRGAMIGSSDFRLSHLFYADDVIILSNGDQVDMDNIIRVLHVCYMASGLKININKSNLYGVGVSSDEVVRMAGSSGCMAGSLSLTYLGLPIGSNMNRVASWKVGDLPLRDRFNRLYHLENFKDCMVRDRFSNGSWSWNWIRPILSGRSCLDFARMLEEIHNMEVTQGNNSYSWYLSLDGNFSVSSLRHHIDDYMLPSISPSSRWCKMIPRKLQSIMCPICNVQAEFLDHTFFSCDTASNVWRLIRIWSDSKILLLSSYGDWDSWVVQWHASKESKDRAYVHLCAYCECD